MAKRRRLTLVSGSSSKPSEPRAIGVATERPTVRAGGLFSEAVMPMVEEDAIVDPDIFFTLPDTISLLQEQITIGNLPSLAQKTGLDQCEINALLRTITSKDGLKLMKIRMALGVQRERNSL